MSIVRETRGKCSRCSSEHTLKVWRSINVSEDPSLRDKVRDGSLFVWECPACHQMNLARYETLYHDPERKLMVWLLPTGEVPESEMSAITNHTKAMGDYCLRRVSDVSSLMEKVLINEAGLDDVVVEMCKYVTKAEMASKAGEANAPAVLSMPMHFYRRGEQDGQEFITLSFPDNGKMVGCNIGWNVYEDCMAILRRNPSIRPAEGFAKVDSDWLNSIMQ